jgi:hypothetical protein
MLEHLSSKFRAPPQPHEPRATLILNRFTRSLTVMFATNAVSKILSITNDQFKDKSFYECIQDDCLSKAIRCLEGAKSNDSIAYLRFWYRDPRRTEDLDEEMYGTSQGAESKDRGVISCGGKAAPSSPAEWLASPLGLFEIEAIVSCTSDGLVVVLRRARPMIPMTLADANARDQPT